MRKLFSTLSLVLMLNFGLMAQVVINEIFYNAPDTDAQEYIELYNAGSSAVNLQGYTFTQGVVYTFGATDAIPAGGYFVISVDSTAFFTSFGFYPNAEWASGATSNGGEDITIYDGLGNLVDSVDYDDTAPWAVEADGLGYSLQLCDHTTDNNDGANWGISKDFAGFAVTGTDSIWATPGAANNCITIVPPPPATYPLYTFSQVNANDVNGVPDSLGVTCELRGIAHCSDFRFSGYDFAFAPSTNSGGIRVFNFSDVNGYNMTEGDSLHIFGTIGQFSGLTQFFPDSIVLISQGNTTATPITVSQVNEATENKYLTVANIYLVDTAEWTGTGSGFNVRVTDGSTDTVLVRIDNDISLYSAPVPLGTFDMTGWGGQFDSSSPYDEGYQLTVCSSSFTAIKAIENNSTAVKVYPNPSQNILNIESDLMVETIQIHNTLGQLVFNQQNVNTQTAQVNTSDLENGVYIISIQTENRVMTQQIQVLR